MKKNRYIFIAIGLILILSGIWYLVNKTNPFTETIGFFLSPLWKSTDYLGKKTREFLEDYVILLNIKRENERLKKEILFLKAQLTYYKERERLYKKLEEFYKISQNIKYPKVAARVIYKPMSPFSGVVFINKGKKDGILPQMPVIAAVNGRDVALVGQVVEVYRNWSKVILIIDPSFACDVKILDTGDRGILVGKGGKYCNLEYLPSTSSVKPGDIVITSGQDALFPPNLLIGEVIKVIHDSFQKVFKYAEVKPVVNLYNLDLVFVLLKLPEIPL